MTETIIAGIITACIVIALASCTVTLLLLVWKDFQDWRDRRELKRKQEQKRKDLTLIGCVLREYEGEQE